MEIRPPPCPKDRPDSKLPVAHMKKILEGGPHFLTMYYFFQKQFFIFLKKKNSVKIGQMSYFGILWCPGKAMAKGCLN